LRRILDRDRADGSCIQTIPGRGYRFTAAVTRVAAEAAAGAPTPPSSEVQVRPRLSIVVLPFTNLSDDREQQYFADGITEDLTNDLSRIENMFVISRNTAFTYRNKPVDTRQIGRELGVHYVLEGSVRRSGAQVRVTAQLIDAMTHAHLWAERFDYDVGDLFALQDEITGRIAGELKIELIRAESARLTQNLNALDYILRGRAAGLKPNSRDTVAERIRMFEHALALDPQSAEAQSRLANVLVQRVLNGLGDSAVDDLGRADGLIDQALAASPRSAYSHYVKGRVLRARNRLRDATTEFETAIALDRNLLAAFWSLAWCKLYAGSLDEVVPLVEQAIRLSPRDPDIGGWYHAIGTVHLLQSRIDEAIAWFEKARSALPGLPYYHSYLAAAYALAGDTQSASAELAEARRLANDDRFSSLARLRAVGYFGMPKTQALYEATYLVGLRKAGMPEE